MKTIDIHAHIVPDFMWRAIEAKQDWHGFKHEPGDRRARLPSRARGAAIVLGPLAEPALR